MRRLGVISLLLALLVSPAARGGRPSAEEAAAARPIAPADFDSALLAREIHRASNRARTSNDRRNLKSLTQLTAAADDQAFMLALRQKVGHDNPRQDQQGPVERVRRRGLRPASVGENVAALPVLDPVTGQPRTYREQAEALVEAWMNSPAHRDNLLNYRFGKLGCAARLALLPGNVPMVFAVQVFYESE